MPSRPSVSGREYFTVDPGRAALIVIDMQNAFVAEGGPLETPPARTMLPKLERLIHFSRECGIPIIWTQSDHRPPFGGRMLQKFPIIGNNRVLWQGESTFDFYPDMLQPREGKREYVIVKHKFDAFFETDLDAILRYYDINTVIITGTATNVCCESTARAAYMRDYFVAFPHDTNATFDETMHQATLKNIDMFFGRVMSTEELIAEMEEGLAGLPKPLLAERKEGA